MSDAKQTRRVVGFARWLGLRLVGFISPNATAPAPRPRCMPLARVTTRNAARTFQAQGDASQRELSALGVSQQVRVEVGPPAASLSVWIVEPTHAGPRATVLGLHGHRDQ